MKVRSEIDRRSRSITLFLLSVCFFAGTVFAQTTTGTIYGTITDASGAVIPGVQVTVTNLNTGDAHTNPTDASGNYTFLTLVPGDYKVTAQEKGFQSQSQNDLRLDANQNVHANFALQAGSSSQEITVASSTALVDTRESQIAFTVDQKRMEDLPLLGRNAYNLVQIVPGVTSYVADTPTGSRQGEQFSVNGLPSMNTAYYLDGAYDTNLWRFGGNLVPNPDALQEFRIITSNFDAEFGRSPGGVINVITRSGGNQFHGTVYDYLRNNILNAKDYFVTGGVTPLKQNQFGATFGGPIRHDKLFFFAAYQGLIHHQPLDIVPTALVTPTAAEAMGDFRATPAAKQPAIPVGMTCGDPHVICPTLLDPVAQNLLKFVPVGDSTVGTNYGRPAQQSGNANINSNQELGRLDYQLTPKHQLSAMYFMSRGTSYTPDSTGNQILSYAGMQNYEGQYNAVASDTWLISPTKVNTLRAFYSLNHYIIQNIYGDQHFLPALGSQAAMGGNYNAQPYFMITGYWTMGTKSGGPNNLPSSSLGAADTFNWTLGKHEIKAGGSYIWDHFSSTGGASSNGLFTFTGSTSTNALVDFLTGHANALTQTTGVSFRSHSQDPSAFVQDNWRLTRKLTLNLGLRWEYFPMYTGQNNTGTFVPNVQSVRFPNAPLGLLTSGDPGIPDGIFHTPWNTFAPRFGFAYDVFGNGKTSLRGAYGIFDTAVSQVALSNNLVQQPFSRSVTVSKTPNLVCPYGGSVPPCPSGTPAGTDPFPYTPDATHAVFLSGANLFGLPPGDDRLPSVQEFSLGIQQQYGSKWSTQIEYVGNVARHFSVTYDANAPVYRSNCTIATCIGTANINNRRPYEPTPLTYTFASIQIAAPVSNSSYHSLQATLTRNFDHHFSLLASYVWSKGMGYGAPVNSLDTASSRGVVDTDVPQQFVASYIWVTPNIHHWGLVGKEVLSGWQLNGITTLRTGQPFNVLSNVDTNFDGNATDRPNVVGDPALSASRSRAQKINQFFNTAAFVTPPAGTPYGNAQYNRLFGPGYINTDLSAFKMFPVYRTSTLQFRADLFNVFNNVNLSNPNATAGGPKFGTIGGTAEDARIVQFSLKLLF